MAKTTELIEALIFSSQSLKVAVEAQTDGIKSYKEENKKVTEAIFALIAAVEEKADTAKNANKNLKLALISLVAVVLIVVGFFLVSVVYPMLKNDPVEIRETESQKCFEVVK